MPAPPRPTRTTPLPTPTTAASPSAKPPSPPAITQFLAERIFGQDRKAMLAAQLPATDAETAQQAEAQAAALRKEISRAETGEQALMTELEALGTDTSPATTAYRARIRERFTQLYNQRTHAQTELDTLTRPAPTPPTPPS